MSNLTVIIGIYDLLKFKCTILDLRFCSALMSFSQTFFSVVLIEVCQRVSFLFTMVGANLGVDACMSLKWLFRGTFWHFTGSVGELKVTRTVLQPLKSVLLCYQVARLIMHR